MNHGRSNDRIDGWWSKPPQDSGQRALVGQRKDPVKETDEPQLAAQRVSLDNADAFIDVLCARSVFSAAFKVCRAGQIVFRFCSAPIAWRPRLGHNAPGIG